MERDKIKRILIRIIPSLIFLLIFSFALACVGDAEKGIEEEIKKEETGVEEAEATVESVKSKGNYISLGESVEYDDLKVTVTDCISMDSYESEYYGTEYPEEGAKFIWICVKAENMGKQEKWLPGCDDFSLLYIDSLISSEGGILGSPSSVNKEGYDSESVMPGISREGWILYEIPKDAKAEDMLIAWEYDYDEYYYWEVPEPLKEVKEEPKEEELPEKTTITIGDTVEEVKGTDNLSITFLLWVEDKTAVDGPYSGDTYYTFTAKPGMKFVIVIYELKNNGVRKQSKPYIDTGEVETDKGYFYFVWSPPVGTSSEEYNPRESTEEEVANLEGDANCPFTLLPEESDKSCVVFEIPQDETPVEVDLSYYIPYLLKLTK